MARILIVSGVVLLGAGLILWLAGDKLRFLGRLPGDIRLEREHFRLYIPLTTMLLLSLVLSLLMFLFRRFLD